MRDEIFSQARDQRKNGTRAERMLWTALRNRRLGRLKFRRQHPLGQYIADFYCHSALLVVEVDGGCHGQPAKTRQDANRDEWLGEMGVRVLRFSNGKVEYALSTVLAEIYAAASERTRGQKIT